MFGLKKKRSKTEKIDVQKLPTNVTSKKAHVSGYIFKENENLISENRVLSPNGDGWLLITNVGMFFILDSAGIYLNLKHEMIDSFVTENDNKVSVHWNEESGSFDYQFRINNGEQEAKRIVILANEVFHYKRSSIQQIELSKSEVEQTKKKYTDRFQKLIEINQIKEKELESKRIMIKNEDIDKQKKKLEILSEITKIRENLRVYNKNIDYVDKMHITRYYKIPETIPVGNVWNDCYFDESRNAFVTFRKKLIGESKKKPREYMISLIEKKKSEIVFIGGKQDNELIERTNVWQPNFQKKEKDTSGFEAFLAMLTGLGNVIGYIIWALVIALGIWLIVKLVRYLDNSQRQSFNVVKSDQARKVSLPTFFADVEKREWPKDLLTAAEQANAQGEIRLALTYLLHFSLSFAIERTQVIITASMTEQECSRALKQVLKIEDFSIYQSLINLWCQLAWAHREVSAEQVAQLVIDFTDLKQRGVSNEQNA